MPFGAGFCQGIARDSVLSTSSVRRATARIPEPLDSVGGPANGRRRRAPTAESVRQVCDVDACSRLEIAAVRRSFDSTGTSGPPHPGGDRAPNRSRWMEPRVSPELASSTRRAHSSSRRREFLVRSSHRWWPLRSRCGAPSGKSEPASVAPSSLTAGVRTESESGRPARCPTPRSLSVARCDTRPTAVVPATAR
jgi:hypothetical protein